MRKESETTISKHPRNTLKYLKSFEVNLYGFKLSGLRVSGIAEVLGKENALLMTTMVDHHHNHHKRKILFYSIIIVLLPSRFYKNVFENG